MVDVVKCRSDTPGCANKIHFNNAGASLMPSPVIDAIKNYLEQESETGGYETEDARASDFAAFHQSMGRLLGCAGTNVAFTSSATNSYARALSCIPFAKGDSILTSNEDYISNQIAFLSLQKRTGVNLIRAKSLTVGGVDLDDMKKLMDRHKPKLVSLSHVPTNTGLVQPAEEVGKLCRERNILYILDACQSVGQMPLDLGKIGCDFATGTFRKFLRGPRGTGFLFVSDRVLDAGMWPLFIDMRGAEWTEKDSFLLRSGARRFEDWELPHALLMGSKASAEYALKLGLDAIAERNKDICTKVRKGIQSLGLEILDKGVHLSSIITVRMPNKRSGDVLEGLRKRNINTSIASRSSAVIDFDAKGVSWALRISPHYYNTEEEIELLVNGIKDIL